MVDGRQKESFQSEPSRELDDLVPLVLAGNRDAARTLLKNTAPAILQVVRGVLGTGHPDLEDVAQEAAIALVSALRSFRGECGVLHFACRVAVFTSLAARRRLEVRMRWADDRAPESTGGSDSHLPSSEYLAARRRSALRELLRDLPEAQAETLVLSAVLGYSPQEIARITGAPANTVRSRLRLAKIALRDRIKTDPELTETLQEAP